MPFLLNTDLGDGKRIKNHGKAAWTKGRCAGLNV